MLIPILDSAIKANRRFRRYHKRKGGERATGLTKIAYGTSCAINLPSVNEFAF